MRHHLILLLCTALCAGCSSHDGGPAGRVPVRIDELAIPVRGETRSYMQSDREGAFLTGVVGGENRDRWSVNGVEILAGFDVETPDGLLSTGSLDSARILPGETSRYYRGGASVTVYGLERTEWPGVHAFAVTVALPRPGRVTLHAIPGAAVDLPAGEHLHTWRLAGGDRLALGAGSEGTVTRDGVSREDTGKASFLFCTLPAAADGGVAPALHGRVDSLVTLRRARMEGLLNASFFRTSDDSLDRAMHWMMLALDGLMVDRKDTFAVSGLPWDGSINVRDNAQSIGGLGMATGDFQRTAGILRSLARYQDTLLGSRSYGRIPDRIVRGRAEYDGADVTPWFVREVYDQVVNTNDTTLLGALYPAIERSIDGTLRTHVDKFNLLVHGPRETWMSGVARGNRASEIQVSWYFQQLIGRFVASYLGDTVAQRRWEDLPEKTAQSFITLFADTAAKSIADHIEADGKRSPDVRPNPVMCLEMLDEEAMRHGVTRAAVAGLLTPEGMRTLAPPAGGGPRSAGTPGSEYNGPVWTWLAGPVSYALTRYDRQDLSFPLQRRMASLALLSDMAGTLPAMLDPAPAGKRASLTGMAEFVRSMYQDYFGVRVDMAAGTVVLQPKLPASLSLVQYTIYAGGSPVEVEYRKGKDNTRLSMSAPALPKEMRVNLLWMMDDGDAWRGSFRLRGGTPVAIVLGDDDAVIYQGDSKGELEGKRKLKHFSQKSEASDISTPVTKP